MARGIQLRALNSEAFLRELHHLLWTEPQLAAGRVDAGWNCRDHALILGLILASFGHDLVLAHGEAVFVRGARGNSPPVSYFQKPHQWVYLQGVGAIDLSVKGEFVCAGDQYRLPLTSVFANAWHPRGRGRTYFLDSPEAFARAERELPQQRNHTTAVYLVKELEHIHIGHVTHSAGWSASVLTGFLDATFGEPCAMYAAAMLHLRAFLLAEATTLTDRSFHAAWSQLASVRTGAIERAIACVQSHVPALDDPRHGERAASSTAQPASRRHVEELQRG